MYIPHDLRERIRELSRVREGVPMVVCLRHAVADAMEKHSTPYTRRKAKK